MKPPKRQCRETKPGVHDFPSFNIKWSLTEKQALLTALQNNRSANYEVLHRTVLPQRTPKEIELFIQKMAMKGHSTLLPGEVKTLKAPIETWLRLTEDLVGQKTDLSFFLADVMLQLGKSQGHTAHTGGGADWEALYSYAASLLQGTTQIPQLSAIDSAIMLDMLESLAELLNSLSTLPNRNYMKKKYQLLRGHLNPQDRFSAPRRFYEALLADLGDEDPGSFLTGISQDSSATESTLQVDSISASQNQTEHLLLNATSHGSAVEETPQTLALPVPSSAMPQASSHQSDNTQATTSFAPNSSSPPPKKRRPGRPRRGEEVVAAVPCVDKDTSLYSLNPFCLPLRYLKPAPIIHQSINK